MPRLFVAIPFSSGVAAQLAALLPPDVPSLRRVAPEVLHLTLAFIGSVGEERVADVTAAIEAAARECPPFHIAFDGLGRFPDRGPARTVWMGTGAAAGPIERLAARVRGALAGRGVPFDPKPLRPHVTLARVRDGATERDRAAIAAAVASARVPAGLETAADAVHVMESVLSRSGPRYASRARTALVGRRG